MLKRDIRSAHGDYTVLIGADLLAETAGTLTEYGLNAPRSVVTDDTVGPLHGRTLAASLGLEPLELPGGETNKTWSTVETICRRWLVDGLDRSSSVLAIGGGIVTDTAGFAAASFMRGVAWVAAPTTLLGMVDAAVGGKTGVNLPEGKNLVGAFWPPRLVVADIATLATLPARELRAGLAEVVKAAWIGDHELLEMVPAAGELDYSTLSSGDWQELVARSVAVKAAIVAEDEREAGRRKALNLGHTLGHALEAATGYERFLHGEAVAWGLEAAAILGHRRGLLSSAGADRLRQAVGRLGERPGIEDLDPVRVCSFIAADKKRGAEGVGWVLPTDDGVELDQPVTENEANEALRQLQMGRFQRD